MSNFRGPAVGYRAIYYYYLIKLQSYADQVFQRFTAAYGFEKGGVPARWGSNTTGPRI